MVWSGRGWGSAQGRTQGGRRGLRARCGEGGSRAAAGVLRSSSPFPPAPPPFIHDGQYANIYINMPLPPSPPLSGPVAPPPAPAAPSAGL